MKVLVINCGSSSIKYRLFDMADEAELACGAIERIGEKTAKLSYESQGHRIESTEPIADYQTGVRRLVDLLTSEGDSPPLASVQDIEGIGHRVVHGGEKFSDSMLIDSDVINAVKGYCDLAPLHNPANLAGIEAAMRILPDKPHVAVFDTAFFQTMPPLAYVYALPYEWYTEKQIRRYGFHGTSHRYVSLKAGQLLGCAEPNLITLHLGNGCSAACIRKGKPIDHSMGFTPLEGLVMGTRCGDVDPAIIFHLTRQGMSLDQIHTAMEKRGGLLGLSGVSRDFRDVQKAAQKGNQQAQLAVDVFVHRAKKYLGAFLAELGHCDAVVFTGGIGEGSAFVRARVLEGLEPLGIELDSHNNNQPLDGASRITTDTSSTSAWVIPTNEELMIARDTCRLITPSQKPR